MEGWDVIAQFGGVRLSDFLKLLGADPAARFLLQPATKARLSRSVRQREPHLKTGVAGFRSDLNISAVFLHNSLHGI